MWEIEAEQKHVKKKRTPKDKKRMGANLKLYNFHKMLRVLVFEQQKRDAHLLADFWDLHPRSKIWYRNIFAEFQNFYTRCKVE